jgi:O-antigen/teichoic acid export membrane protein
MYLNVRINEMLFPTLVERLHSGDRRGFDLALVDTMRYSAATLGLMAAVGGGAAAGVMSLFGPGFGRASSALAIIMAVPVLVTLTMILRNALYALNRPWTTMSAFARMVVTIGAGIPLAIAYGPSGPAIAICAGLAVDIAITSTVVRRRLETRASALWRPREVGALLLAYGAGFAATRWVYDAWPNLAGLTLGLAAGTIAYVTVFVILAGSTDRDRDRIRSLRARLRSRHAVKPEPGRVA